MSWHHATSGAPGSKRRASRSGIWAYLAAMVTAGQAGFAHEPAHLLLVDHQSALAELFDHARHPVVAVRRGVDLPHQLDQLAVGPLTLSRAGLLPADPAEEA